MKEEKRIHIWEASNIGKAPFTVRGMFSLPSKSLLESNPDAYNNAIKDMPRGFKIGTCGVCGQALKNNFLIEDANGQKFSVGCECIFKSDMSDKNLTTKIKELKKAHERKLRQERNEAKRLAKLQAQREKNGGLTDYELREKEWAEKKAEQKRKEFEERKAIIDLISPLAEKLEDGKGAFCDSVASELREGKLPKGRGLDIMVDILAKQEGRRGSKKYEAEKDRLWDLIDSIPE